VSAPSSWVSTTHEDGTECSETLANKIQMLGQHPKERIQQTHHCNKILLVDWTHQFVTLCPTSKNFSGVHHRAIKFMTLFPDNGGREGLKHFGVLSQNDTQLVNPKVYII
jgi:hypothetical protein